jgi:hypothetical protein
LGSREPAAGPPRCRASPARLSCPRSPAAAGRAQARDYSARLAQLQLEFQAMLREVLAAAQARLDAAHSAAMLGQRGTC